MAKDFLDVTTSANDCGQFTQHADEDRSSYRFMILSLLKNPELEELFERVVLEGKNMEKQKINSLYLLVEIFEHVSMLLNMFMLSCCGVLLSFSCFRT